MFKPEEKKYNFNILKEHLDNGFIGVKIHSAFNFVKVPKDIIDLVEFMQNYDRNLILFIHSTPKTVFLNGVSTKDVAKLAKNYPNLKIMLGHAAYTMESAVEVGMMLKKFENVFFETSCCVSFGIYNLIKSVGHKRILFGSDSPTASSLPLEIQKITHMPRITDEMKQDILYNNIVNFLSKES